MPARGGAPASEAGTFRDNTEGSTAPNDCMNTGATPNPESTDAAPIYCPIVTPFEDEEVDVSALRSLVEHLVDRGVDGFVPCGTTGEFSSLTAEEQRRVVETTVETAPDSHPVIAGTGGTAIEEVRDRLTAAADAGADAALVVSPYYLTASDPTGNREFFDAVVEDSPLPVYLYNIPDVVGEDVDAETVATLAERDAVVGTKDTSGDLTAVTDVLARVPEGFAVLQGFDGQLVPGLVMGMDGGVNALAHVIPDVLRDAVTAVENGHVERARDLQRDRIGPLFGFCRDYGFAPAMKVALAAGDVIDSPAVRPPLVLPDAEDRQGIERAVDRASRLDA